ncbi:hypothetical protein HPP92_013808 [Vanilla planifolia]|uniref:Uncharacterized protein n=1 Tax=Vanilla planifolia TaxID=51239 RepID=A0A835QUQ8_VANPL|nr:hypothetical protein HPP92_013808 [Vanilla planifolia]
MSDTTRGEDPSELTESRMRSSELGPLRSPGLASPNWRNRAVNQLARRCADGGLTADRKRRRSMRDVDFVGRLRIDILTMLPLKRRLENLILVKAPGSRVPRSSVEEEK